MKSLHTAPKWAQCKPPHLSGSRTRSAPPWNKTLSRLVESVAWSFGILAEAPASQLVSRLKGSQWASALDLADSISQKSYGDAREHFAWNQLASLVRKVPFRDPLLDPKGTATRNFLEAETLCSLTNRSTFSPFYSPQLEKARQYIERCIGLTPNLRSIYELCDFGPGSNIGVGGTRTHLAAKLSGRWSVTPTAAPYAYRALMSNHQIHRYLLDVGLDSDIMCIDHETVSARIKERLDYVSYNKVAFVPKTAKTNRSIAVEPLLNSFLQKGIDMHLRGKLRRFGHNLADQSKNCRLAQIGSKEGYDGDPNPLCTIDLKMASDSLSMNIVKSLLPPDWFTLLNNVRSPSYVLNAGEPKRYEKFCSMGNGFCFPLETLIFASLAYACDADFMGRPWAVYGDDIVLQRRAALQLVPLLEHVGFRVNEDKTFIWGPFRESCGADYFGGENVRPYTLAFLPDSHRELIKMANGIQGRYLNMQNEVLFLLDSIVPNKRYVRPYDGPPEEAITVPLDVFMGSSFARWDSAIQNWRWTVSRSQPRLDRANYHPWVEFIGALRGSRATDYRPQFALRTLS